jgi:uncharacterized protein with PIN domain/tRNA(Ser,Leu) C12 N-acetylase TAN1
MATYLIRFVEIGREQQAERGKQRRDLAAVVRERIPAASVAQAPGRLVVDTPSGVPDVADMLAAMPGVNSVSPCVRVSRAALETAIVELARKRLAPGASVAVRVRRRGEQTGPSAGERSIDLARRLGELVSRATGARIDLTQPDLELGVELRDDEAFVFDRIIDGIDRTGPQAPRAAGEPRFLADQMLGRLAARLRLLGYDTLTVYDLADSEVTRLAAADGRILLTRDGALAKTLAVPVHYVAAAAPRAQLAEIIATFDLHPDPDRYFSRCTLCNEPVEPVAEADVHDRLPPRIRDRGLAFVRCPACAQIYWRGSHVERILAELVSADASR